MMLLSKYQLQGNYYRLMIQLITLLRTYVNYLQQNQLRYSSHAK